MAVLSTLKHLDPTEQASAWLTSFAEAINQGDYETVAAMFLAPPVVGGGEPNVEQEESSCFWRDLVSFTWNIYTCEGRRQIRDMLVSQTPSIVPGSFKVEGDVNYNEAGGVLESFFVFETEICRGKGHIRLKKQNDEGGLPTKCWTFLTTMVELKGYEEKKGPTRPLGLEHGYKIPGRKQNWLESKTDMESHLGYNPDVQPYCVIIGGGQGGIGLAARLKRLDVPTIIIEKNDRPGDSWRKRYHSLCLHDPVWYDHLPYLPFPEHWPVFSPKDKIGDWLEMYTKIMELNYWASTECQRARYDDVKKEWTVTVVQKNNKTIVLHPKQLILATGMSGVPNIPNFKGMTDFTGSLGQWHSSTFSGKDDYKGKKCVVIGSNNSSHDICAALWEQGADVTMIQRSSTHIVKSDSLMDIGLGDLYSERALANGIDHHKADLIFASLPYKILHTFQIPVYKQIAKQDAVFYTRLQEAGFLLDWGDDGSGLFMKYLRRGSGYYIDIGASDLIINGGIKLQSGCGVREITKSSVILENGTELADVDLIVYATGYGSMNGWAEKLISKEVADKVGKCWGLGSETTKDPGPWEGEQRNMWKPTHQEALWFHGGNLHQSRHYSQFLSLQIKARFEGVPTPVYGMGKVHHLK